MKTRVLVTLSAIVFVMAGFVTAEEAGSTAERTRIRKQPFPTPQKTGTPAESKEPFASDVRRERLTSRGSRGQSSAARNSKMYQDMLAKQGEKHRAAMKELEDIKKIAEEEDATKTVEAIQALIDKKTAEYQVSVKKFEKARKERTERLEQRLKEREAKETAKTEKPEAKTEADSDEDNDD